MDEQEWTNDIGANIRDLPEELIDAAIDGWISESSGNDLEDTVREMLPLSVVRETKIVTCSIDDLAKAILAARFKEFHSVTIEAEDGGLHLCAQRLCDEEYGTWGGDNVTPFRQIKYSSLLAHLVECIEDAAADSRDLQELRSFATSILAALDEMEAKYVD